KLSEKEFFSFYTSEILDNKIINITIKNNKNITDIEMSCENIYIEKIAMPSNKFIEKEGFINQNYKLTVLTNAPTKEYWNKENYYNFINNNKRRLTLNLNSVIQQNYSEFNSNSNELENMFLVTYDNSNNIIKQGNTFLDFDELALFQTSVRKLGWGITIKDKGEGGYHLFDLFFKQQKYRFHIYLRKLSFGGNENRPFEKRVQFGATLDRRGFEAKEDGNTVKVILGVYGRENSDEYIFCGWDINEWGQNEGRAFNCFIDVDAISNAFKFGMAKHTSAKGQVSYAFKSEFLIYYLFSQKELFGNTSLSLNELTDTEFPLQKILFGPPGTGKSTKIKQLMAEYGFSVVRTTFHPDTDYQSFVGGYKPTMVWNEKEGKEEIAYKFVPQAFTNAYVRAHKNPSERILLVIEEINRGNCAQIFGDLFQCLDRDSNGKSEYEIDAEADLAKYLAQQGLSAQIGLPPNLYIYATMNTSDQSLFPMDSAFKRRWDWQYVPIDYKEASKYSIEIGDKTYNWGAFIEKVNAKIKNATESEDKQLGNFFVKADTNNVISLEAFKSKVMFYLWAEIFKYEITTGNSIFEYEGNGTKTAFTFAELFEEGQDVKILQGFMAGLEIPESQPRPASE
ncbi:MAG: AAA family ATPase, partial [Spirosomaceae bacterium]|nr:AAA family ATPase [Spirosomataceae bacterium]